jgi:threonine/homoserine/homoserine lactone efflux protein
VNDILVLGKGVLAGLAVSAPVGPVTMSCVSYTIANGRRAGVTAGLGASTVDTVYGTVAAFSITFVIGFLLREEFWIRIFGGIFLAGMGIRYFFRKPASLKQELKRESPHSAYVSTFLLNLANPTVVLSFLLILTALGLPQFKTRAENLTLVIGIFTGAMLWWILLTLLTAHFRDRLDDRSLRWMNRIAGVAIGGFGLATFILAFG